MNSNRLQDAGENLEQENNTKEAVKKLNNAGETSSYTETNTGNAFNVLNLKESIAVKWRDIDTIL